MDKKIRVKAEYRFDESNSVVLGCTRYAGRIPITGLVLGWGAILLYVPPSTHVEAEYRHYQSLNNWWEVFGYGKAGLVTARDVFAERITIGVAGAGAGVRYRPIKRFFMEANLGYRKYLMPEGKNEMNDIYDFFALRGPFDFQINMGFNLMLRKPSNAPAAK